jgi:hypothetical protein
MISLSYARWFQFPLCVYNFARVHYEKLQKRVKQLRHLCLPIYSQAISGKFHTYWGFS